MSSSSSLHLIAGRGSALGPRREPDQRRDRRARPHRLTRSPAAPHRTPTTLADIAPGSSHMPHPPALGSSSPGRKSGRALRRQRWDAGTAKCRHCARAARRGATLKALAGEPPRNPQIAESEAGTPARKKARLPMQSWFRRWPTTVLLATVEAVVPVIGISRLRSRGTCRSSRLLSLRTGSSDRGAHDDCWANATALQELGLQSRTPRR